MSGLAAAFCFASLGFAASAQTTSSSPAAAPSSQPGAPSSPGQPAQQSAPPLQLHDLPSSPHTPTPQEAAQQEQQRVLAAVSRLASMQAEWGPPSSTPGLSIALKEVGRAKAADGTTQITWQITGTGFPPNQKLDLMRWALDARPQTLMSGVQVDSRGVAVCVAPPLPAGASGDPTQGLAAAAKNLNQPGATPPASPTPHPAPAPAAGTPPQGPDCSTITRPGQPVQVQAAVAPGEAVRVALVGDSEKDGKPVRIGAATSLVPYPIQATDKACTLQVIRGMKNAGMVLVDGTGFPANTSLKVDTDTDSQTRTIVTHTNADGHFILMALPALAGKSVGDMTIHMGGTAQPPSLETPKTPAPATLACNPSLTFHWGTDSYKPQ